MQINTAATQPNLLLTHQRPGAQFSQPPASGTTEPKTADVPQPNSPMVDRLLARWGETNSRFDFDGDGKVGTGDLLMLLQKQSQLPKPHEVPAPMPEQPIAKLNVSGNQVETKESKETDEIKKRQSPLERLLAAWGQTDSEFDLIFKDFMARTITLENGKDQCLELFESAKNMPLKLEALEALAKICYYAPQRGSRDERDSLIQKYHRLCILALMRGDFGLPISMPSM